MHNVWYKKNIFGTYFGTDMVQEDQVGWETETEDEGVFDEEANIIKVTVIAVQTFHSMDKTTGINVRNYLGKEPWENKQNPNHDKTFGNFISKQSLEER